MIRHGHLDMADNWRGQIVMGTTIVSSRERETASKSTPRWIAPLSQNSLPDCNTFIGDCRDEQTYQHLREALGKC